MPSPLPPSSTAHTEGAEPGPQQRLFLENVERLVTFVETHGRFPGAGRNASHVEKLNYAFLCAWRKNRTHVQAGRRTDALVRARLEVLDERAPGWDRPQSARDAWFRETAEEVREFVATQGRYPAQSDDGPGASRLYLFVLYCRVADRTGSIDRIALNDVRRAILDEVLPGWNSPEVWVRSPRGDAHFEARVLEIKDFASTHGRLPFQTATDLAEYRLADVLANQRIAAAGGHGARAFSPRREALLDEHLPGWRTANKQAANDLRFDKMVLSLKAFVLEHGHLPTQRSSQENATTLRRFLARQRSASRGTHPQGRVMTSRERDLLDLHVPGWEKPDRPLARSAYKPFELSVAAVKAFVAANGSFPTTTAADEGDRSLANFLRIQRTQLNRRPNTQMSVSRRNLLDTELPGWQGERVAPGLTKNGVIRADQRFHMSVDAVAEFKNTHGTFPRRTSEDPSERRLAQFVMNQRQASNGKGPSPHSFTAERRAYLDEKIPGWAR